MNLKNFAQISTTIILLIANQGSRARAASSVSKTRNVAATESFSPSFSLWRAEVNTPAGPQTQIMLVQAKTSKTLQLEWQELHLDQHKIFEHQATLLADEKSENYFGQTRLFIDYSKILGGQRPICSMNYLIQSKKISDDQMLVSLPRLTKFYQVVPIGRDCNEYYPKNALAENYLFEKIDSDSSADAEKNIRIQYEKQVRNVNFKYAKFEYENRRSSFVIVGQTHKKFQVSETFLGIRYNSELKDRLLFVTNDGRFLKVSFDLDSDPYQTKSIEGGYTSATFSFYHQTTDADGQIIVGNLEREFVFLIEQEEFQSLLQAGLHCPSKVEFERRLLDRKLKISCL